MAAGQNSRRNGIQRREEVHIERRQSPQQEAKDHAPHHAKQAKAVEETQSDQGRPLREGEQEEGSIRKTTGSKEKNIVIKREQGRSHWFCPNLQSHWTRKISLYFSD